MMAKDKLHIVDRPEPGEEYKRAWLSTGMYLESLFKRYNRYLKDKHTGFCWLRAEPVSPTFDSMNFRFKNQVYSVLINLVSDGHSYLSKRQKDTQIEVCNANDMIPCLFTVSLEDMRPVEPGWNLRHTVTKAIVDPKKMSTDAPRPVSEWELANWGISFVKDDLEQKGYKVLSFTDAPGIFPQMWFEDSQGRRSWVQVVVNESEKPPDYSDSPLENYPGYLAIVSLTPLGGDPVIFRSRPADIEFEGLERI
jgi:hypothetical protein